MKKRLRIILVAALAVAAFVCFAMLLTACAPKEKKVFVTLVGETLEETVVQAKPGDPLPVLELEDRDFEGYWTDSEYSVRYEGTTVPDDSVKLYYKANLQYYTLVLDFGDEGSFPFEMRRGVSERLPDLAPLGTHAAGFAETEGGSAKYLVTDTVKNLAEKGGTVTLYARYEINDVGDYTIEDGVVTAYNGSSTSLTLPLGATKIAAGAFAENKNSAAVLSLTVPQSYTAIERGAFEGLTGLEMLTVPFIGGSRTANRFLAYTFGAETYEDNTYSFAGYSDGSSLYMGDQHMEDQLLPLTLKTVRVTESVGDFAEGAFYGAYALENVVLSHPEDLRSVGNYAFAHCLSFGYDSALGLAVSPAWLRYVTSIGDSAFESYTGNTSSSVQYVYPYGEEYPEYRAELLTYEYPFNNLSSIPTLENIETIGSRAFYYAAALNSVEFGNSLRSVGSYAFIYALSIDGLRFPDTLQTIGDFGFYASGALEVEFGTGIRSIGARAFDFCSNLSEVMFRGTEPPELHGGCFSNSLTEVGDNSFNIEFTEFRMYIPADSEQEYKTAVGWEEYVPYMILAKKGPATVYWSLDGAQWDAKFEFTDGSRVYVTDPNQTFISDIDWQNFGEMTYGLTCGTYYPMMYEVLTAEEYAATAKGSSAYAHAKPLYENQYILHLWHPELLDYDGTMITNLYFIVSELPYEAGGERVLVPVMEQVGIGDTAYGDTQKEGSYLIMVNNYGVPQIGRVVRNGAIYSVETIEDPAGTYYAAMDNSESGLYTFTYYDSNFALIDTVTYTMVDSTGYAWQAPIYEKLDEYVALSTNSQYNDSYQFYLDGVGGGAFSFVTKEGRSVTYNGTAVQDTDKEYGEEGFTVTLNSLKDSSSAAVEGVVTAVFRDYAVDRYNRIDITFGDLQYSILNVTYDDYWYSNTFHSIKELKTNLPKIPGEDSLTDDSWRYTALSSVTLNSSMSIYRFSTDDLATISYAYYREYVYLDDGSTEIRFGTVRHNADGSFTLISDAGEETSAVIQDKRGSFLLGDKKYTRYDNSEDMTLALTEIYYGVTLYYYTVKTDGYGNMYILDEHDDGFSDVYLGTYDDFNSFVQNGSNYYELQFTGKLLDEKGNPVGEDVNWWILYDFGTLQYYSDVETDCYWYGSIAAIYTDHADQEIVVFDAFGYKLFELTVDVYGNTEFVQYTYTIDRNGYATYTEAESSSVSYFVAVTDVEGNVQYCVAFAADGSSMYSVHPSADGSYFTIVYDGGIVLPAQSDLTIAVDTENLQTLPAGGVSFGTLA